jgi:chorismate mutase/prephenate dehydrogenase
MSYLEERRREIDEIDRELVGLLEKRFKIVYELKAWKKKKGISMEDRLREREIVRNYLNRDLPVGFISKFYEMLFRLAKN